MSSSQTQAVLPTVHQLTCSPRDPSLLELGDGQALESATGCPLSPHLHCQPSSPHLQVPHSHGAEVPTRGTPLRMLQHSPQRSHLHAQHRALEQPPTESCEVAPLECGNTPCPEVEGPPSSRNDLDDGQVTKPLFAYSRLPHPQHALLEVDRPSNVHNLERKRLACRSLRERTAQPPPAEEQPLSICHASLPSLQLLRGRPFRPAPQEAGGGPSGPRPRCPT